MQFINYYSFNPVSKIIIISVMRVFFMEKLKCQILQFTFTSYFTFLDTLDLFYLFCFLFCHSVYSSVAF